MTPGKTNVKFGFIYNVSTGAGTAGLSADIVCTAMGMAYGGTPATYSVTPNIVDLGSGYYSLAYALFSSAGFDGLDVTISNAAYAWRPVVYSGEVQAYDETSLAGLIARGQGTASVVTGLGAALPIILQPYRFAEMVYTITGLDLTEYSNFCLAFRDQTQEAYKVDLWFSAAIFGTWAGAAQGNLTIAGTSGGLVTITLPQSLVGPVYGTWTASQAKKIGDCVVPTVSNGYVYMCTTVGTGNATQPTWPTTPGTTVTEASGGIVWTCLAKSIWQASTVHQHGDYVTPQSKGTPDTKGLLMRCITAGTSGTTEPTWPTTPSDPTNSTTLVTDGTCTWQVFNDFNSMLGEGVNSASGFWELTGQNLSTGLMESLTPSSPITLTRREVGT